TPARGIGERTLDEVRRMARSEGLSLWRASQRVAEGGGLAARARNALAGFHALIDGIDGEIAELPLKDKIDHVLQRSGLRVHYTNESKGSADSRVDNLDELVSVASRFVKGDEDDAAQL